MPAKIILFDIETTNLNGNVGFIVCGAWKELGEDKPHLVSIKDYPAFKKDPTDDRRMVKEFAEAISQADAWVTWYGKRFDVPMINTRLLAHGLKPLPYIPHIDGWETARKKLKLTSNRLATVSSFLGMEDKTPLTFEQWRRAAAGHRPSIKYVEDHCLQDVQVLEQVYERIKPFSFFHPNVNLVDPIKNGCPTCGEASLQRRGYHIAKTTRRQRFQCTSCGAWSSGGSVRVKDIVAR